MTLGRIVGYDPTTRRPVREDEIPPQIGLDEAAERYEATPEFVSDALDWLAGCSDVPADVVEVVCNAFRRSRLYEQTVEDVMCGDRVL